MEKDIINKIFDMTISLNKSVGGLEGKINSVITHIDTQDRVNGDLHSRISGVQKRVDSVDTKLKLLEAEKTVPQKTFFDQLVHYTKGAGVVSMFLYGLYNVFKQIGFK